jgi:hypothetical protein
MRMMTAVELLAKAEQARASGDVGMLRAALVSAFEAARSAGDVESMATAALAMPTSQRFGVHPGQLPALLHEAYQAAAGQSIESRLAAALARSWVYGGDTARAAQFAAEAARLADQIGTPEAKADALDAALLCRWGPDDFSERLSLAAQLDDVAAHLTDPKARMSAHLWRLTTAWECLDAIAIQRQMRALDLLARETGSGREAFFAVSRRAMHALATFDLDSADSFMGRTTILGADLGEPDVEAIEHSLRAMRALVTDDLVALGEEAAAFDEFGIGEGIPSVMAEAAVLQLAAGHPDRANQLVTQIMSGGVAAIARDVDFLLVMTSVAKVAASLRLAELADEAAEALEPYAGRGVVNAGAVTFHGVVDDYIFQARHALGDDGAEHWRHAAQIAYRRIGASWWERRLGGRGPTAVATRAPRRLRLAPAPGDRWSVGDEGSTFTLPDLKGLHYLRYLIERPGTSVAALVLTAALAGHSDAVMDEAGAGEVADPAAIASYRRRLRELEARLDGADHRGDQAAAIKLSAERDALVAELRSATGRGGRPRRLGGSAERARVAVRKAVAGAMAQIERNDPAVARVLRTSVQTGTSCRYEPDPDHPVVWELGLKTRSG